MGYHVIALDFNDQLLAELAERTAGFDIAIQKEDIRMVKKFAHFHTELIVCCGDTLSHLSDKEEIRQLISDAYETLAENGQKASSCEKVRITSPMIQEFLNKAGFKQIKEGEQQRLISLIAIKLG